MSGHKSEHIEKEKDISESPVPQITAKIGRFYETAG